MASLALLSNSPPLTLTDIEAIVRRIEAGDQFTDQELKRLERNGAICHGEFLVTVFRGELITKRYIGVDASEI